MCSPSIPTAAKSSIPEWAMDTVAMPLGGAGGRYAGIPITPPRPGVPDEPPPPGKPEPVPPVPSEVPPLPTDDEPQIEDPPPDSDPMPAPVREPPLTTPKRLWADSARPGAA